MGRVLWVRPHDIVKTKALLFCVLYNYITASNEEVIRTNQNTSEWDFRYIDVLVKIIWATVILEMI